MGIISMLHLGDICWGVHQREPERSRFVARLEDRLELHSEISLAHKWESKELLQHVRRLESEFFFFPDTEIADLRVRCKSWPGWNTQTAFETFEKGFSEDLEISEVQALAEELLDRDLGKFGNFFRTLEMRGNLPHSVAEECALAPPPGTVLAADGNDKTRELEELMRLTVGLEICRKFEVERGKNTEIALLEIRSEISSFRDREKAEIVARCIDDALSGIGKEEEFPITQEWLLGEVLEFKFPTSAEEVEEAMEMARMMEEISDTRSEIYTKIWEVCTVHEIFNTQEISDHLAAGSRPGLTEKERREQISRSKWLLGVFSDLRDDFTTEEGKRICGFPVSMLRAHLGVLLKT